MKRMPELTARQAQVVERVAHGLPDKRIARDLHISTHTVQYHIREAASRLPGDAPPRRKLTMFFFNIQDDDD